MKNIYLISGLGADERVYSKINFGNNSVTFIPWLIPEKNETIEAYALRLSKKIINEKPILIGLSFGGMMAVEVAKHIQTEKIILISSSKNKSEVPFYYRLAGKLLLNRIVPTSVLVKSNKLVNKVFATRSNEDKKLVASMIANTDIEILKWSIDKIVNLKNKTAHSNLFHIHGTADRILPCKFVKADYTIKGGKHLMIMTRANEVEEIIMKVINS
jgi:esterase/lipase